MREKLARAGHNAMFTEDFADYEPGSIDHAIWLQVVDAILDALMEPSEEMKAKAWYLDSKGRVYSCHVCGGQEEGWQAMLKVAKEG